MATRELDEEDLKLDGELGKISTDLPVVVGSPTASKTAAAGPKPDPRNEKPPLPPGQGPRIGNYQLAGRFRSGPFALVFLAHRASQLGIARPVVLKVSPRSSPHFLRNKEMMVDEYNAMASLDHPNVVQVFDAAEVELGFYVAVEYVDGLDAQLLLEGLAKSKRRMPIEVACHIVVELLRGLEHAHTARGLDGRPLGIVHRDVNPANVLLSRWGQVKLTDFGVVKMRGRVTQETQPGLIKGKPAYLPPEYIRGEHLDHRCDVYSAGIFLFELVTGQRCFRAEGVAIFNEVLQGVDISRLQAFKVPEKLVAIIAKATEKDPKQRFGTASEMGQALEQWLAINKYYVSATAIATIAQAFAAVREQSATRR